jgi:hypothetical protein
MTASAAGERDSGFHRTSRSKVGSGSLMGRTTRPSGRCGAVDEGTTVKFSGALGMGYSQTSKVSPVLVRAARTAS